MKKTTTLFTIAFICITVLLACKKDDNITTTTDYKTLLQGKWLWYKTITTGSSGNPFDTFYNKGMFKEFLANGKVITEDGSGAVYTENYFITGNKLGQTYNNQKDTAYSDIKSCTAGAFSIYDKIIYSNVSPPAVVEYWNYFIK